VQAAIAPPGRPRADPVLAGGPLDIRDNLGVQQRVRHGHADGADT
jgi:hypothetical protein